MPKVEGQREIVIVDYDPSWPARFELERARIVEALGDVMKGVVTIEHVGSTAVSGCPAKPIIDIMIGVRALAVGERCIAPIEALGYEYRGEAGVPGRYYFRKGDPRSHHVHLVEHHREFWERHIAFRDVLRAHPDLAEQYGQLKRELATKYRSDRLGYTDAKTPFIESVLARARRP